jgi:hypothetical protein
MNGVNFWDERLRFRIRDYCYTNDGCSERSLLFEKLVRSLPFLIDVPSGINLS